jgi:hypothetical protein
MHRTLYAATAGLALLAACGAALAEPTLGKVETLYAAMDRNVLVELKPGARSADFPLVADVRLRDAAGQQSRRVLLRLDGESVERGDIVAVIEGERGSAPRIAPMRSRDQLAHIEAKHDTPYARNFFRSAPDFLALKNPD